MTEIIIAKYNYWVSIVLMMIGLYAVISKNNLIKKVIGLAIFQTSIILFYVSISVKRGATIPILEHHGDHHAGGDLLASAHASPALHEPAHAAVGAASHAGAHLLEHGDVVSQYANPLPHVLMLTAIVVGVATLGVALALIERVYSKFGSIEEDEILARLHE